MVENKDKRCKWGQCDVVVVSRMYCDYHRTKFNAWQRKYRAHKPEARWAQFRNQCIQRELVNELTFEQFRDITSKPCDYCGESANTHRGIDRLDNAVGYTHENSVPCCWNCNRAKGIISRADFYAWIRRLTQHFLTNKRSIANLQEVKIR